MNGGVQEYEALLEVGWVRPSTLPVERTHEEQSGSCRRLYGNVKERVLSAVVTVGDETGVRPTTPTLRLRHFPLTFCRLTVWITSPSASSGKGDSFSLP